MRTLVVAEFDQVDGPLSFAGAVVAAQADALFRRETFVVPLDGLDDALFRRALAGERLDQSGHAQRVRVLRGRIEADGERVLAAGVVVDVGGDVDERAALLIGERGQVDCRKRLLRLFGGDRRQSEERSEKKSHSEAGL